MFECFEVILYVSDQQASKTFYEKLLNLEPVLNVPGMTEFALGPALKLGLMPEDGIARIITPALPHPSTASGIPRCELYLLGKDVEAAYAKALELGAKTICCPEDRDWGHRVAYVADADGHVIAFAQKTMS